MSLRIKHPYRILFSYTAALLLVVIFIFNAVILYIFFHNEQKKISTQSSQRTEMSNAVYLPSRIMKNQTDFIDKTVVVRGKIKREMLACTGNCPANDPCCNCDTKRNLYLIDENSSLFQTDEMNLMVVDAEGNAICTRQEQSCQYQCSDFDDNSVYQISGKIAAQEASKNSLFAKKFDYYYLIINKKEQVKKAGITSSLQKSFEDVKNALVGMFAARDIVLDK